MRSALVYVLAAVCEIGGCFAFWAWLRQGRSALWTIPGVLALIAFAMGMWAGRQDAGWTSGITLGCMLVLGVMISCASLKIRKSQLQNDLDRLNASLATDPEAAAAQGAAGNHQDARWRQEPGDRTHARRSAADGRGTERAARP